ncbi:hypothetical protein CTEN210_08211 [Chaetoceros tenuissimus]|uniref:Nucleoporin Nup54 alpha-helical domain-containing protein n=1 Tax=Chaetoceros tenuissimus TaxID=426638 RepID=A0AAD3CVJ9_9STRA|nr:hypothetical protein CTEN210_08211 [Chaetoceros tenuissimus]
MGFSFGTTQTPAPAPSSGFSFGASTTPAPAAPAPAPGGLFGSTPAPAFGGFGATSPAPATGGLFGSKPASAPAGGFGSTAFGPSNNTANASQISASTPFSSLPQNAQKMVDDINSLVHQHNQTMASVTTMLPSLLNNSRRTSDADKAAGSSESSNTQTNIAPLTRKMQLTQDKLQQLKQELDETKQKVEKVSGTSQNLYKVTYESAIYPVQSIAARNNIALPRIENQPSTDINNNNQNSSSTTNSSQQPNTANTATNSNTTNTSMQPIIQKLNQMLNENSSHVDRVEGMPSVYLWNMIQDLNQRLVFLHKKLMRMKQELERKSQQTQMELENFANLSTMEELSLGIQIQTENLVRVADMVSNLQTQLEMVKEMYKRQLVKDGIRGQMRMSNLNRNMGIGIGVGLGMDEIVLGDGTMDMDPFYKADQLELQQEQRLELEVRKRNIEAAANVQGMTPHGTVNPTTGAIQPAPAPAGGLFGSTTPAPAPAFGGFGASPAPAAATGGLFGAPAPAPATGGLFGSTPAPAPATGGLFGSTPAPAPATGGLFGAPAPAPATGGLFGSTPAPAPATGGLFGAPAPAPAASGGLFGTPAATPATKSKRRGAGRRR